MRNKGWLTVLLFLFLGCVPSSKPPVNGAAPTPEPVMEATPGAVTPATPKPAAGPEKPDGTTLAEGPLQISKMNPVVDGWFLPREELSERFENDWMKLTDRRLRIRGTTEIYHCPPESQCLTTGSIPRFRSVTEVGLVCRDGRTLVVPRRCPSPRCLERCEVKVMSRHDACGRNAGPNWPAWCGQDNREMRENCEAACAADCKPQPDSLLWCD